METNKLPKARENAGDQVVMISFSLHLIGLESGASFLDQSQSEVEQSLCIPGHFDTQLKIALEINVSNHLAEPAIVHRTPSQEHAHLCPNFQKCF